MSSFYDTTRCTTDEMPEMRKFHRNPNALGDLPTLILTERFPNQHGVIGKIHDSGSSLTDP